SSITFGAGATAVPITLSGPISLFGLSTITASATAGTYLAGSISDGGAIPGILSILGAQPIFLTGATNNFTGGVNVSGTPTVVLGNNNAFGAGPVTLGGSGAGATGPTIQANISSVQNSPNSLTIGNPVTLFGTSTGSIVSIGGSNQLTFNTVNV